MERKGFLRIIGALIVGPAISKISIGESLPIIENKVEVDAAASYISGYMKVSKQMMANLPWLQENVPTILLKEFEKNENTFYRRPH